LAADETGHVATVAITLFVVEEFNCAVPDFFGFVPADKVSWAERLMASAALTGRAMFELSFPGVSGDLLERFV
tara:strand:- start:1051 stop:1269 length:219 start_codon:yes stop_codon:yes gene_type:complete